MATKAEIVVQAKDQASAVLKGIGSEFNALSGIAGKLTGAFAAIGGTGLLLLADNAIKAAAELDDVPGPDPAAFEEPGDDRRLAELGMVHQRWMVMISAGSPPSTHSRASASVPTTPLWVPWNWPSITSPS